MDISGNKMLFFVEVQPSYHIKYEESSILKTRHKN